MSVEVERKFLCSADTMKTLEEIGVCVGQRQFHDEYFDTPEFDLTLRDTWLRKRKGCWELKCPSSEESEELRGKPRKEATLCSRYKEITNLPEIQQRVKEVMKDAGEDKEKETGSSQDDDESWLRKWSLVCFAEFTTVRRSFTLEEGVRIDLDQADFGYHVGEIEVLIPEGGNVQCAEEKIRKTARKLGITGNERVKGKMDVYLKKHHPEHYAQLLSAHVL